MPPRAGLAAALCFLTTAATLAYWALFFLVEGTVQASADACYLAFERAFPAADAWMATCTLGCGLALLRRRSTSLLWGLLGASALVYLGCMDVLYDLENRMYARLSAVMGMEIAINVYSLAVGAWLTGWCWRHRAPLMALQGGAAPLELMGRAGG